MTTPAFDLTTQIAGIRLKNPILGASGTFGYGLLYGKYFDLAAIGGFVTKGISIRPKAGNPPPRIIETNSGMLNAIGLQNVGFDDFVFNKLPKLKGVDTAVIVNFFGSTVEEYAELAAKLDGVDGVAGLEMNLSCPNIKEGGIAFGSDAAVTEKVVSACRQAAKKPLIVKLSPNVTGIAEFARACEGSGADAISVINTVVGMAIDIWKRKPVLSSITGGLSGPAIKPIALRMVWQCYKAVKIPVFGIGGITNVYDVAEFMMAGASAVQIGSMNFVEPSVCADIAGELPALLASLGAGTPGEIIGAAHNVQD